MTTFAQAQARRKYVRAAISRYLVEANPEEPLTRKEIFRDGGPSISNSHNWTELTVLKKLSEEGILEKIQGRGRGSSHEYCYILKDRGRLQKILRDPVELTSLIWPKAAQVEMVDAFQDEDGDEDGEEETEEPVSSNSRPEPVPQPAASAPAPVESQSKNSILKDIAEKQDAILEVMAKPLVDNLVFVRDRILGMESKVAKLQETMDEILEELTKPFTVEEINKIKGKI